MSENTCPECGIVENVTYNTPFGEWIPLTDLPEPQYSCEHYKQACPRCVVCRAPNAPVKQVPVGGVPCSDAYCDTPSCVAGCRKKYLPFMLEHLKWVQKNDREAGYPDYCAAAIADVEKELSV